MCFVVQAKLVVIAQEQQAAEIREIRGDVVKVPFSCLTSVFLHAETADVSAPDAVLDRMLPPVQWCPAACACSILQQRSVPGIPPKRM
jgi:hypothetical protein